MGMKNVGIVLAAIVLVSFPFLGIYGVWKDWLAFAIGVAIILAVVMAHLHTHRNVPKDGRQPSIRRRSPNKKTRIRQRATPEQSLSESIESTETPSSS